ncbi:Aste57867_22687 [Aphanomyces stellatus]|uniref:Aste57867_22687 protein n=1 Tax=Aphanomyces stellatus TaxID=120398 RepID=A0A485LKV6_9STRA|nr:hypothetical protein As57867_022617 [Aphanomyces stellatus]VFT99341.1 Aste57867_22687 [Aphanomyces stellatus]
MSLNPNAKTFSFNPAASSWAPPVPSQILQKPKPVAAAAPPPTPAAPAAAPVSPKKAPTSPVKKPAAAPIAVDEKKAAPAPVPSPTSEDAVEEEFEALAEEEIGEEDPREHINVVLIGHVDAGKSTLSGNILYLMDQVDKRTIERFEKEAKARNRDSWFLAFIMDTGEEERAKGKTVEVGRAQFDTANKRFTILDAPGHKNYVPNMIQGASQADVGILVISARKGEFETGFDRGGQTREHAMLAKTLGINKLIVVINKMDDAKWAKERFDECADKLRPFLRGCGFAVKRDVAFIPISGLSGDNIKTKVSSTLAPWYDGVSLIDYLDTMTIAGRNPQGPLRVPVLDRYLERGTIVLGKVESGVLATGAKIVLKPTNVKTTVAQVYINEKPVRTAKPGENVTMRLTCNLEDVTKGFVLCNAPATDAKTVTKLIAQLAFVDALEHRPLLTAGYKAILHCHTIAQECTITKLLRPIDPKTGEALKKKVMFVKTGQSVICRIEVEQSITVETFETLPQLGRLTLRDEGKTIAVGKIVKLESKDGKDD